MDTDAALRRRYRSPEYALFFEVRNTTGYGLRVRSADAVAMNLYPSRGMELIGIEVKQSRSDWLNELKNPEKADAIFQYCDRWYLATAHEEVAKAEEIPPTWGWLVPRGKNFTERMPAPRLNPKPISRAFLASLLRQASTNSLDEKRIADAVHQRVGEIKASHERFREEERLRFSSQMESLKNAISEFERESGILIRDRWNYGESVGKIVKLVLEGGTEKMLRDLRNAIKVADGIAERGNQLLISYDTDVPHRTIPQIPL